MYCCSSFLVFLKHTFSLEQEPEPAKKNPELVKNGPAPQHWFRVASKTFYLYPSVAGDLRPGAAEAAPQGDQEGGHLLTPGRDTRYLVINCQE